jgi:TPP-dependent pyruvate/acetoin dehydrogenase alpha subunit
MPVRECRVENNNIYKIAEPFCIESCEVDGNDVLKVYEAAQKAIDKCRAGDGPVFLECLTYRFRGHVGSDDNIHGSHTDIRPKKEVEEWFRKDPIRLFENYLSQNKLVDEGALDEIRRKVQGEVDDAHIFTKNSPMPDRRELTRDVYR